jgi:hypothetical protein
MYLTRRQTNKENEMPTGHTKKFLAETLLGIDYDVNIYHNGGSFYTVMATDVDTGERRYQSFRGLRAQVDARREAKRQAKRQDRP